MTDPNPTQGFLIRTLHFAVYGVLTKEDTGWVVTEIDPRLLSFVGLTAQELKDKCEGFGWKVERWKE